MNESECLEQLDLLKTFQRNVFSGVISQKKKKKLNDLMQDYISNTIERKKLQKFKNLIVFTFSITEQSRQNRNM